MLEPKFPPKKIELVAHSAKNVPHMFLLRVGKSKNKMAYMVKRDGRWVKTTWGEFGDLAVRVGTYFIQKGVKPQEKIAIMGSTRPEWCISDIGGLLSGAVTIGVYPTLAPPQLKYLLEHGDVTHLFVEKEEDLKKVLMVREELPLLKEVIVWNEEEVKDYFPDRPYLVPFSRLLKTEPDWEKVEERVENVSPDSTAILIYTSGTTGPPKGAMLSHRNILTLLSAQEDVIPIDEDDYTLSFLPMAHGAERVLAFYGRISSGLGTAFATSIPAVLEEVKEVRPTLFGSVPRIFEKAYARIMSEVEKLPPRRKAIFRWAERVGRTVVKKWQKGEEIPLLLRLQYSLARKLVFSRIQEAFGGRVKYFVTGAAPIAYEILEFFWAAGFPIYEVYGLTEATVVTHANRPGAIRLGSVGKPIHAIQDRIAEDGEILIGGPMVFQGYYKDPEATREAIDEDGWLHTGDIGYKDEDGFLYIKDRKKHIIITSGGKNITPANLENEIKNEEPLISQVYVHGDRRPYLVALITVHPLEALEWGITHGLIPNDQSSKDISRALMENPFSRPPGLDEIMEKVTQHPEVRKRIVEAVRRANARFSQVEKVKRIYILNRDLSLEENEITPTLKVKRKEVEKKFLPIFDRIYQDPRFGEEVEPSVRD